MITATFTDGIALYCVIPSKATTGVFIVEVRPTDDGRLLVAHRCPAKRQGKGCTHVWEAVNCYYRWKPWDQDRQIVEEVRKIILQPHWEKIHVPSEKDEILAIVEADDYVT